MLNRIAFLFYLLIFQIAFNAQGGLQCQFLFGDYNTKFISETKRFLNPDFVQEINDVLRISSRPTVWTKSAKLNAHFLINLIKELKTKTGLKGNQNFQSEMNILLERYQNDIQKLLNGDFNFIQYNATIKKILALSLLIEKHDSATNSDLEKEIFQMMQTYDLNADSLSDYLNLKLEKYAEKQYIRERVGFESRADSTVWYTSRQLSPLEIIYATYFKIDLIGLGHQSEVIVDHTTFSRFGFSAHDSNHSFDQSRFREALTFFIPKLLKNVNATSVALAFLFVHEIPRELNDIYQARMSNVVRPKFSIASLPYNLTAHLITRLEDPLDLKELLDAHNRENHTKINGHEFVEKMDQLFLQIFSEGFN